MAERRLGELHHAGPGLVEELGGAAQQPLSLREGFRQLLLPLHKLGVALHGDTKGEVVTGAPGWPADMAPPVMTTPARFPGHPRGAGPLWPALQETPPKPHPEKDRL